MRQPLIAVVGETATGKSDLALDLAKEFNAEIVSADSWVVRKGVDIGTAKPDKNQMELIRHHMIDIIEPDDDYSAARYKEDAVRAINGVYARGKIPIVVGGTGLYVDAVLYDYSFLPNVSKETREELNSMNRDDLLALALTKHLPLDNIDIRNKRRIIRLIETNGGVASKKGLIEDCLVIGLSATREQLSDRITKRVDTMLINGLEDEVEALYLQYGWGCEALKGIGYHEWRKYFEGTQSIEITKQRIIKNSLMLAKRQRTWFKRNKSIRWFTTPVIFTDIEDLVTTYLNKNIFL